MIIYNCAQVIRLKNLNNILTSHLLYDTLVAIWLNTS